MKKLKLTILIVLIFVLAACDSNTTAISWKQQLLNQVCLGIVNVEGSEKKGSGVVVEVDNNSVIIVTNYHVIEADFNKSQSVKIKFFDKTEKNATILGVSIVYDVAVLKTDYIPDNIHIFDISKSFWDKSYDYKNNKDATSFWVGQDILSAGIVDNDFCVYDGIISCYPKLAKVQLDSESFLYVLESTVAAPKGTSGGATFDLNGNFVGLNAFSHTANGVATGISYKIPAPIVSAIVKKIKSKKSEFVSIGAFSIESSGEIDATLLCGFKLKQVNNTFIIEYNGGEQKTISAVNGKSVDVITFIAELFLSEDKLVVF